MPERRRLPLFSAAAVLAALMLGGLAAPWLAPFDPATQLDPPAGSRLPPLSLRYVVPLANGGVLLAEDLHRHDGGLEISHRGETVTLRRDEIGRGEIRRRIFLLGTDEVGRDVLSRLLYGARLTFLIAFSAIALMTAIGVSVGTLAALGGRLLDAVLMRLVDGLLAFPWIFLLITLVALWGSDLTTLVLVIGMSGWMSISRLVRAEVLSLAQRDFVLAARALGAGPLRIFLRHMVPHLATPLVVQMALGVAGVISTEAALSFLGLGVAPPQASWGRMIAENGDRMLDAWWASLFPALALVLTVIALNLIGDGLRDALDPRSRSSS
ncbi:MAG: ABC transporter permease [Acidobacteria bacterium]|nr:MAG: ABC transporter permease [Acidobacteriota bacterium]